MWIGFNQFHHPLLIIFELSIMVIYILVNMALQLVNKLLLSETIEFFWNEYFVVTECRDNSLDKGKAFKKAAYFMDTSTNEPAFGDQFFNLLGIDHDRKSGTVEIVAYALPRNSLSCFNHNGKHNNLNVCESQFLAKVVQGILALLPELIRQSGILGEFENTVHGCDDSPSIRFLILGLFIKHLAVRGYIKSKVISLLNL